MADNPWQSDQDAFIQALRDQARESFDAEDIVQLIGPLRAIQGRSLGRSTR